MHIISNFSQIMINTTYIFHLYHGKCMLKIIAFSDHQNKIYYKYNNKCTHIIGQYISGAKPINTNKKIANKFGEEHYRIYMRKNQIEAIVEHDIDFNLTFEQELLSKIQLHRMEHLLPLMSTNNLSSQQIYEECWKLNILPSGSYTMV